MILDHAGDRVERAGGDLVPADVHAIDRVEEGVPDLFVLRVDVRGRVPQRPRDDASVVDCLQHGLEVGNAKVREDRRSDFREFRPLVQAPVVEVAAQVDGGTVPDEQGRPLSAVLDVGPIL